MESFAYLSQKTEHSIPFLHLKTRTSRIEKNQPTDALQAAASNRQVSSTENLKPEN
jgi:hypothetical protein